MFEHDFFISYAHVDNERLHDPEHGWIDLLHRRLEIRLKQLLGEKPNLQAVLGYEFYSLDAASNRFREFGQATARAATSDIGTSSKTWPRTSKT